MGNDGAVALNGSFQVVVADTVYQRVYDLVVSVSAKLPMSLIFMSPASKFALLVSVQNIGGVPRTPPHDIEISLQRGGAGGNYSCLKSGCRVEALILSLHFFFISGS